VRGSGSRQPDPRAAGAPIQLPGTPNQARGTDLDAYTDAIMNAVAALLPPDYRGSYDKPASTQTSPQADQAQSL
jgi:hypothetical protein